MNKETLIKLRKICMGFSVLCVEDDEAIASQLNRILSKIFSNVDVETDGAAGLENYRQNRHEIVITDISMPIMNGVKMAHEIKKINKDQSIIIVSAHSETNYMTNLIRTGVDNFILKPINMESFIDVLAKSVIKVYKEKREKVLEARNKKQVLKQESILSELDTPIITIEEGVISYANRVFKEYFLREIDGPLKEFNLSYIFKDEEFVVLKNEEVAKKLSEINGVYQLYHADLRSYKNYKIDVAKMDNNNLYVLSFINIDAIKNDLDKVFSYTRDFSGRSTFAENIALFNDDNKKYKIYCFGLKNINKYIKEYGVKQINNINRTLSSMIKKEFAQKLEDSEIEIYLFDTNRYIAVADESNYEFMQESLGGFGTNYKYIKGIEMGLHLDFISNELDFSLPKREILENAQAMIYLLKG